MDHEGTNRLIGILRNYGNNYGNGNISINAQAHVYDNVE